MMSSGVPMMQSRANHCGEGHENARMQEMIWSVLKPMGIGTSLGRVVSQIFHCTLMILYIS